MILSRRMVGLALLANALATPTFAQLAHDYRWFAYTVQRQAVDGLDFDVDVMKRSVPPSPTAWVWVARKTAHRLKPGSSFDHADVVQWADERTCPQLAQRLALLRTLEPLTITLPGEDEATAGPVAPDGTLFTLKAAGRYLAEHAKGEMTLTGGVGSPLAAWVDGTEKALSGCWKDSPPA